MEEPIIVKRSNKKILIISLIAAIILGAGIAVYVASQNKVDLASMTKEERRQIKLEAMQNGGRIPVGQEGTETGSVTSTTTGTGSTTGGTTTTTTQAVAGSVSQSEVYAVTTKTDVTYGIGGSTTLKLDVYMPSGATAPTPAIIYIHGGGFKGGNKTGVGDDSAMLAKHGVAAVAVDYRLSGTAVFPAPLYDVKGAVRFIKAHATEYNIDPNAIFSLGESAGGVLASLLGVTEGNTTLEGSVGGNLGYTSNIAGVIDISGSYVASIVDTMSGGIKNSIANETGCSPVPSTACASIYTPLSAETYISSGDSPFIILHGSKDQSVPQVQAETLNAKLLAAGVASEIYIAPDLAHVGGLLARYLTQVINFLNTNS